jgi:hypothetical protein
MAEIKNGYITVYNNILKRLTFALDYQLKVRKGLQIKEADTCKGEPVELRHLAEISRLMTETA